MSQWDERTDEMEAADLAASLTRITRRMQAMAERNGIAERADFYTAEIKLVEVKDWLEEMSENMGGGTLHEQR